QRSVHNNYMTLPVLFIMISNHYPLIYAAPLNWLWVAGLGAAGVAIRHFFNLKNAGRMEPQVLALGALIFVLTALANAAVVTRSGPPRGAATYAEARAVVEKHCLTCHSARPSHRGIA